MRLRLAQIHEANAVGSPAVYRGMAPALVASIKPEFAFAHILALVAHHPDMSLRLEDLQLCCRYLEFYVETVAEPANLDFLYHVAATAKGHADGVDPALSAVRGRGHLSKRRASGSWACILQGGGSGG